MQHLRDALRSLRSAPMISAAAVLSLALGIGANTAIFSIVNALLLKPLPVREPQELVAVTTPSDANEAATVSYRVWTGIRDRGLLNRPFVWTGDRVSLSDTGVITFAEAIWASGDFFDVLGVETVLGRPFGMLDDRRGGGPDGPVAVISHAFWQRRFGGAPGVIGRALTIERVPFTIVGVTPPGFLGLNVGTAFDVVMPLETEPLLGRTPQRLELPQWTWLQIIARRAPGETVESMTAALRNAQPQIREETMPAFPRAEDRARFLGTPWSVHQAAGGVSRLRRQYGPALITLLGVVSFVVLIACANIATLLLGRATARQYELSVRLALGASRVRLLRQLFTESLLLAAFGAAVGAALALWGSRLLVRQLSTWASTPVLDLAVDWRVLGVTAGLTVLTAVLFGTLPAFRAMRVAPIDALKLEPRAVAGSARMGAGAPLVIVQVAVSLVLLVGAGLFLRSFAALAYRDLGFDRSPVLVAVVDSRYSTVPPRGRLALYERVRESIAALPDVQSAAISMATPLGSAGIRMTPVVSMPGAAGADEGVRILTNPVSPNWFQTFGTRIIAGRDFNERDAAGAAPVLIVNESFARRYFPGTNPIGRTIVELADPPERRVLEIVGVVEDAAFTSVREPVAPTMYGPIAQRIDEEFLARFPSISISVRGRDGAPARLSRRLVDAIGSVDPRLGVSFQTVSEQLNAFYVRERLLAMLSGFFGVFAVILAALGLYSTMSYAVTRRRTEIGIRMAVGADARSVVRLVLGRVALLVALGIATGAIISLWAGRFVSALLFEVPARDPVTFGVSSLVLLVVAGLAGWLPARRAARIDPAVVLREG